MPADPHPAGAARLQPAQALRTDYRARRAALFESIRTSGASTRGVGRALSQLARLADATLRRLWEQAAMPGPCALVAVGGYGRGRLFPHSDIDVLVLLPDEQDPELDRGLQARIEAFIGSCWDTGLEIGSSVRTVAQCLAESARDVTVQTALLESRLIVGHRPLFLQLQEQQRQAIDPRAFFVAKTLEMRQRHSKFEDTPYALEPNCKESPAACATCRSCCGYRMRRVWEVPGRKLRAAAWRPHSRCAASSATRT